MDIFRNRVADGVPGEIILCQRGKLAGFDLEPSRTALHWDFDGCGCSEPGVEYGRSGLPFGSTHCDFRQIALARSFALSGVSWQRILSVSPAKYVGAHSGSSQQASL